jgi:hypothetical protein
MTLPPQVVIDEMLTVFGADRQWFERLALLRHHRFVCLRCGAQVTALANIGMWHCTQHAVERADADGVWPCCGRRDVVDASMPAERGCVRCDHVTERHRYFTLEHVQALPAGIDRMIEHLPRAVVAGTQRERLGTTPSFDDDPTVYVARHDWLEVDRRAARVEQRRLDATRIVANDANDADRQYSHFVPAEVRRV